MAKKKKNLRITLVRSMRPFPGCVMSEASCFRRSSRGASGSIFPSAGKIHAARAISPVGLSQRWSSSGFSRACGCSVTWKPFL